MIYTDISALPKRHYRCITVDFPWKFSAGTKGRPQHYERMTIQEVAAFPIWEWADPEGCWILPWMISSLDGPEFWEKVWPAWKRHRIRYSARAFVWIKTHRAKGDLLFVHQEAFHTGTGYTTRKNAEDVRLFKIGSPRRLSKKVHELIVAPLREHSRKPEEFYRRVEAFCTGPRLDLFSREPRAGWDAFGNEATKFQEAAE